MRMRQKKGWQKKVRFVDQRNAQTRQNLTPGVGSSKVKLKQAEQKRPAKLSTFRQQRGGSAFQQQRGGSHDVNSSPEQPKHLGSRRTSLISNRTTGGGQNVSTLIEKAMVEGLPNAQKKKWKTDILRKLLSTNKKAQAPSVGGQERRSSTPVTNRQGLSGQSTVQISKRPGPLVEKTSPNSVQLPVIRNLSYDEAVASQKKKDEKPKDKGHRKSLSMWGALQSSNEKVLDPDSQSSSESSSSEKLFNMNKSAALMNPHIGFIFERLNKLRSGRVQTDVNEEVRAVHERVNQALKNVDFMFEDGYEKDHSKFGSVFDASQKRSEIEHQAEITEMVKGMIEGTQISQGLLADVDFWFEEMKALGFDVKVDEELDEIVSSSDVMRATVMKSLGEFSKSSSKMVDLGNRIIKEAGNIIKENEAEAKKMSRQGKDKIIVYDEHDLMVDQVKWEKAVKLIVKTFEDALKWTRNATYKVVYTKAQKQFKNLSSAMSKKMTDLTGKQREVDDLKKKLFDAKASVEKKHIESEELKKNIRRMSRNIEEQAKHIETQENRNQGLTKKLMGTEQKMKVMENEQLRKEVAVKREMEEKDAALEEAMAKPPTPPPAAQKKAILKVIDPELVQKLKDTEEQLESSKITVSNMSDRIKDVERTIVKEKEKVKTLKEDLKKAEKDVEEAAMQITIPETVMDIPELSDVSGDKDSAYYKKLLTGMKRDFSQELEKLKSHLRKEKQRGTAAMKRNENVYKDHLNAIQKDVIRVLRSIMHFRDHVCGVLEKENLKDPVFELQQLKNLIPDQLAPDPKDLLTLLVANVVEYMHNMEVIIANAFLAMRMIIKGSVPLPYEQQRTERKTEFKVKDAQTRIKTMDSAKYETVHIAKRLKMAKNRLEQIEQITAEDQTKDKKYVALLDRYYTVWKMYNKLQQDMNILQGDFQTNIDEKIKQQEQMAISTIKLDLKQRKALHENQLKLSINDQKDNLRILERTYDDNKISKELYTMASAMLQKAVSIPGKRLKYLFEQYIAFRSVKDARVRIQKIIEEPDLAIDVRQDLESYTRRIESRIHANMGLWHERIKSLEDERKNLNQSIWKLFNEVLAETGVLLVHPLFKRNRETGQVYSQMAQMLKREQMKKILKKRGRMTDMLKLPPVLVGSNVVSRMQPEPPFWKGVGQGEPMPFEPLVDTPHTLHYDVNRSRINAERLIIDEDLSRHAYPLAKIQNYIINPKLTTVRC